MSILSTDFIIEQLPNASSSTAVKGVKEEADTEFSLVNNSQAGSESESNNLAQQTLSFSEHLSTIQQNGINQASVAGNKLPLLDPNLTNLPPEISNHQESGKVPSVLSNNNVLAEGVDPVRLTNLDLAQTTNAEGLQQAGSASIQAGSSAGTSSDNTGKTQSSIPLEPTIDRYYESDRFGQALIRESDNTSSVSVRVNNDSVNDVSVPLAIIPVEKNSEFPVSSRLPDIQKNPVVILPTNGLSYEKQSNVTHINKLNHSLMASSSGIEQKLEIESAQVNPIVKNKNTSESLVSNNLSEQILDTTKIMEVKKSGVEDESLVDKLELNPKSKLMAQLNKNSSNNVEINIAKSKMSSLLSNNSVFNQEVVQPQLAQNINSQNLAIGQTIPAQNVSNVQMDQNANNILQQGLSLRQGFSPNLAHRIQWIYQQALTSAEILMDPPDLGPLSVKLRTHQGETNILFQVSNPQTKEMIEDNLAKLKEMLGQQGIQLGDTQVEHRQSDADQKEGSARSHSLLSTELENTQRNDSLVQTIGLLDTYA